jgi:serralysin
MSNITQSITVGTSSNTYLSGILWGGSRWYTPSSPNQTIITYGNSSKLTPNAAETSGYLQVFADISKVCNVTFVQGTAQTADILLNAGTFSQINSEYSNGLDASTLGIADPPGTYLNGAGDEQSWVSAIRTNYSSNALYKGGYDYITWMHEIGHAMGLAHPHDNGGNSTIYPGVTGSDSLGYNNLNQGIFTTMSYNDGWEYYAPYLPKQYGWQATMMAFDIAALQFLYGANYSTATGSDFYSLRDTGGIGASWQCIWDAGGTDGIYYGGNYASVIDLRAATLDPNGSAGAGGFASYVYGNGVAYWGFTIANGAVIENGFGGNANDTLIGNDVGNLLYGYNGSDTFYGLGGVDIMWGGAGVDTLRGGDGDDLLIGADGSDYLYGDGGKDDFFFNQDIKAGDLDYIFDLSYGTDYIIVPTAYQGSITFFLSNGAAYGYVPLAAGGYYLFGAAGLSAAQLQASTFYYG